MNNFSLFEFGNNTGGVNPGWHITFFMILLDNGIYSRGRSLLSIDVNKLDITLYILFIRFELWEDPNVEFEQD